MASFNDLAHLTLWCGLGACFTLAAYYATYWVNLYFRGARKQKTTGLLKKAAGRPKRSRPMRRGTAASRWDGQAHMIGQFMLAAQSGDLPEIKRLVGMGIGIDACHVRDGKTALMKASESGYHDVVMFLMEKGAQFDGDGGRSGKTALIRAAERGHWQVVEALLRAGANPNARSRNRGKTALMGAIGCGNLASALLLIKAGADVHARNWQGETAEDIGAKHGRLDLLELLRNRGADFTGHAGSGDSHSQGEDADEWYEILGCQKTDSRERIRAKYLDLMKQYHPDMIQAKGLPNPFLKFANERCMLIQDAYQRIMKDKE